MSMRRKSLRVIRGGGPSISGWSEEPIPQSVEVVEDMSDSRSAIYSTSSGGVGSSLSVPNPPSAGSALAVAIDNLKSTAEKRIATIQYLKRAHGGKLFWFNTVLISPELLKGLLEPERMRSRTTRFAVLGMSLSSILDIAPAQDFLRALASLVQEFDSVPDDRFDRNRNRTLFRGAGKGKKSTSMGGSDFSIGSADTSDASYLLTPNIPFDLDYTQVFTSLCDLLIETYQKILIHLGSSSSSFPQPPSSAPPSSAGTSPNLSTSRLTLPGDRSSLGTAGGLSPALIEIVVKIDSKLKKIIVMVSKEFDGCARQAIKTELNALSGGGDWANWGETDGA